jgi:hypothetical protein
MQLYQELGANTPDVGPSSGCQPGGATILFPSKVSSNKMRMGRTNTNVMNDHEAACLTCGDFVGRRNNQQRISSPTAKGKHNMGAKSLEPVKTIIEMVANMTANITQRRLIPGFVLLCSIS